jgi:hypothetical protein
MALGHSPQIVTNGLAFYYDMGNPQKSWKGAPTTNLYSALVGTNLNSYNGWDMPGVPGAASQIVTNYGSWDGNTIWRVTVGVGTIPGFASWRQCLPANYDSVYGTTRRLIAKVKMLKGSISNLGSHSGGGTGGATYTAIAPSEVSHTINDKTGWFLLDLNVSGSYPSGHCVGIGILAQDIEFLVAEMGVYPSSSFLPYTPTSRSNTQAVVDLSGNNTITATSLTYAANNTFSFNGTDSELVSATTTVAQSAYVTTEAWVRRTGSNTMGFIIGNGTTGPNGYWISLGSSGLTFSIGNGTSGYQQNAGTLSNDTIYHVCGTYDGTSNKIYVNGSLVATNTSISGPINYTSVPQNFKIGNLNGSGTAVGRWFLGNIYSAKIYNRALTAAEVQQNFNALRGRYGL